MVDAVLNQCSRISHTINSFTRTGGSELSRSSLMSEHFILARNAQKDVLNDELDKQVDVGLKHRVDDGVDVLVVPFMS